MRRTWLTVVTLLLLIAVSVSAVSAGTVHFGTVKFSLGSLIADGVVAALGRTDVTVVLEAQADVVVTCTNKSGKLPPGKSRITSRDAQILPGTDSERRFSLEAEEDLSSVRCPSRNWTADVFVYWTGATLSVYDANTGALLVQQRYRCVTTRYPTPSVECTPVS